MIGINDYARSAIESIAKMQESIGNSPLTSYNNQVKAMVDSIAKAQGFVGNSSMIGINDYARSAIESIAKMQESIGNTSIVGINDYTKKLQEDQKGLRRVALTKRSNSAEKNKDKEDLTSNNESKSNSEE